MQPKTDSELVALYAAGGAGAEAAFAEIVRRHGGLVYAACRRLLGDAAAEDAVQAVFMLLARKARTFSKGEALAGWLYGAASLVAREHLRSARRRTSAEKEAAAMREAEKGGASGPSWSELRPEIDAALGALPKPYRDAVMLSCLEGKPEAEVARELGVPAGTVKSRLSRGLEALRERLGQRGTVTSAVALVGLLGAHGAEAMPAALAAKVLVLGKVGAAAAGIVGAAATVGAQHAVPVQMMEGAMKAMFWVKIKLAAAVLIGATVVGGGGAAVVIAAAEPDVPKVYPPGRAETSTTDKGIECQVVELIPGGKVKLSAGSAQGVREKFEFDVSRDGKAVGMVKVVTVEEKQSTAEIASVTGEIKVGDTARTRFGVVVAEPGAAPAAKPAAVFAKVVSGSGQAGNGPGRSEDWICAETAKLGSPAAVDNTGWLKVTPEKQMLYASEMGGRLIEARETGRTGADVAVEITGYKIGALRREQKIANKTGEHLVIRLTDYPGAGNLFLALRVGEAPTAPADGIAWGEAVNGLQAGLVPLGGGAAPSRASSVVSGLAKHLKAGKSVVASLAEIARDNPGRVADAAGIMEKDIRAGKSLAEAMAARPEVFDAASIEAVRKGEDARTVDVAMAALADKLAAAGQGDGSAGGWAGFECPKCHNREIRKKAPRQCNRCGQETAAWTANPTCPSCAAKERICTSCGAAKPWGGTFVEGEPLSFELHLRNVGDAALNLNHPGSFFNGLVFTPVGGGIPRQAIYTGPVPAIAWQPVQLDKGRQVAFVVGPRREDVARGLWRFEDATPGRRTATAEPIAALPAGKYTVTASYEHAQHAQFASCPYWHGKVTTGAVEIEIRAKGAAGTPAAAGAPDETAARRLALEYAKAKGYDWGKIWTVSKSKDKFWMVTFEKALPEKGPGGAEAYPLLQVEMATGKIVE